MQQGAERYKIGINAYALMTIYIHILADPN